MDSELDGAALDRILRRAHELDSTSPGTDADLEALMSAAAEVGISRNALLQSIATESLGPVEEPGAMSRLVGPGELAQDHVIDRPPDEVLSLVDQWMTKRHRLKVRQRDTRTVVWTQRSGIIHTTTRRAANAAGVALLGRAHRVTAVAVAVPREGHDLATMLRITVDQTPARTRRLIVAGVLGAAGTAGTATTLAGLYLAPVASIGFVAVAAGGAITAASGRKRATTLDDEVTSVVSAVAEGRAPGSLGRVVGSHARQQAQQRLGSRRKHR